MVWFGFGTKKETPGQEDILFWLKAAGVVVLNMRLWFCFHTHTLLFSFAATNTTWNFPDISSEIYHFIAHKAGKRPDISSDTLMKVEMQQIFCKFAAPLTRLEKVPTSRLKHPVVSHLHMLNVVLNSGLWPSPAPQLIFRWRQHDMKPLINTHIWQYWWFESFYCRPTGWTWILPVDHPVFIFEQCVRWSLQTPLWSSEVSLTCRTR